MKLVNEARLLKAVSYFHKNIGTAHKSRMKLDTKKIRMTINIRLTGP